MHFKINWSIIIKCTWMHRNYFGRFCRICGGLITSDDLIWGGLGLDLGWAFWAGAMRALAGGSCLHLRLFIEFTQDLSTIKYLTSSLRPFFLDTSSIFFLASVLLVLIHFLAPDTIIQTQQLCFNSTSLPIMHTIIKSTFNKNKFNNINALKC